MNWFCSHRFLLFSFPLAMVCLFMGCTKPPDYPIEPVITFMSLSKNTMIQSRVNQLDSLNILFSFTDGDGDLGLENGANSIFLIDKRTGVQSDNFSIPTIPPLGSNNGISGEITLRILTTCCIFPDTTSCDPRTDFPVDTLQYEIYIVDKAGNESNRIVTDPIFLDCTK